MRPQLALVALAALLASSGSAATQPDLKQSPYVYTRLRYDQYALKVASAFQRQNTHEEEEFYASNGLRYFLNPRLNGSAITEDDLILEALDQVYRSRLLQSYVQSYAKAEQRALAADRRLVSADRCRRELEYLVRKLNSTGLADCERKQGEPAALDPELASFFDSFGTQEAGLLMGNYYWIGDWTQCKRRHILDLRPNSNSAESSSGAEEPISFTGRYCVVALKSAAWNEKIERKVAKLDATNYFAYPDQRHHYRQFFRIQVGVCLPESCDSTLVDWQPDAVRQLAVHKLKAPFNSYQVADLYCLPDETSDLRRADSSGRLLLALAFAWLAALLAATAAHARQLRTKPAGAPHRLLLSLSLIESFRRLVEVRERKGGGERAAQSNGERQQEQQQGRPARLGPTSTGDLAFLDAIKVAIMPAILVGHVAMFSFQLSKNALDFESIPWLWFNFLASTTFYVDWFFCISGFIASYSMFATKLVYTNTAGQWLYSLFHRYWRLAPAYLLLFWFNRSLYHLTGSGPTWDYATSGQGGRAVCQRESWLIPLTLTQNWHPLHQECVMPAWYIANDMQFYLITPPLLILLARKPTLGWLLVAALVQASIVARATFYLVEQRAQHVALLRPKFDLLMRNSWDLHQAYLLPHYRLGPYLLGLLAGHYSHQVRAGHWSPLPFLQRKPSQARLELVRGSLAYFALYLALTMNFCTGFADKLLPRSMEPSAKYLVALLFGPSHTLASLAPALLMSCLALGQWRSVRAFMQRPWWRRLARINYLVYLYQVELINWLRNKSGKIPEVNAQEEVQFFAFVLPLVCALAFLATLTISNPLDRLEREFVGALVMGRARRQPLQRAPDPHRPASHAPEAVELVGAAAAAGAPTG